MRHLSEEELILLHYGERLPEETRTHAAECAECSAALTALANELAAVDEDAPEPAADYEAKMWQRVEWQLHARSNRRRSWFYAAAAMLLVLVGFLAGRLVKPSSPTQATVATTTTPQQVAAPSHNDTQSPVLTAAAREQVDRSARLLVEVSNDDAKGDAHDITAQRAAAEELLASNRLVRATAKRNGADETAQLLDDIEPILLELAHAPASISADELSEIQKRIESRELLFKLRVISSTLRDRQQKNAGLAAPNATSL